MTRVICNTSLHVWCGVHHVHYDRRFLDLLESIKKTTQHCTTTTLSHQDSQPTLLLAYYSSTSFNLYTSSSTPLPTCTILRQRRKSNSRAMTHHHISGTRRVIVLHTMGKRVVSGVLAVAAALSEHTVLAASPCNSSAWVKGSSSVDAFKKMAAVSPEACCTQCALVPQCDFFTFDSSQTGQECHLKQGTYIRLGTQCNVYPVLGNPFVVLSTACLSFPYANLRLSLRTHEVMSLLMTRIHACTI